MSNKLNSIRDKEAKESYETDKQRMSNIKEAGIIGKRFFLVHYQTRSLYLSRSRSSALKDHEKSYLDQDHDHTWG